MNFFCVLSHASFVIEEQQKLQNPSPLSLWKKKILQKLMLKCQSTAMEIHLTQNYHQSSALTHFYNCSKFQQTIPTYFTFFPMNSTVKKSPLLASKKIIKSHIIRKRDKIIKIQFFLLKNVSKKAF